LGTISQRLRTGFTYVTGIGCFVVPVLLALFCFAQTDFMMYGAPKDLRVTWMFWGTTMNSPEMYESTEQRAFKYDQPLVDYFNIKPSQVMEPLWLG
jgi:hypothetical protein